jgi:hypothetical protein
MANRKVPQAKRLRPIGVSLPPDLARKGRKLAFNRGISFSKLISTLLEKEVDSR